MEDNRMGLRDGSNEYWKIEEHAERLYRKKCDSTGAEKEKWIERCRNLADQLREEHGYNDPVVERIIEKWYLDWD